LSTGEVLFIAMPDIAAIAAAEGVAEVAVIAM